MRKVLTVLAIVVMAVAVWLVTGGREEGERVAREPGQVEEEARSGEKEPGGKPIDSRQPLPGGPMMAGREAEFEQDEEPEGPLLLEGQVLDEGGLAVEGATVTIDTKPPRTATTERDGTFQFEHLIGRQYVLTARLGDRAGGPVRHQLTEKSPPVIIRLKPASSVEVTVFSAGDGKPVAGAGVELRGAEKRRGQTGAGGRLVFRGVPSGWYSVKASADGFAPAFKPVVVPPLTGPRPVKVELRLKEGAELSGEVVDEDGAPVAGAHVLAVDTRRFIDLQDTKEDGAVTDEEGRFVIPALPAGTYRIEATHEKYAPGRAGPVEHDGQRPKGGIRIVMEGGGVVSGRVVDASGAPVAWASVRVVERSERRRGRARFRRGTTADERGEFELKGLPRGRLALVAVSASASSDAVEIDLAQEKEKRDLEIVLDVTGSIAGKVVTSSGEPVPEVQVIAVPDFWKGGVRRLMRLRGRAQAMTDGGGNFELKGLPDGDYRLHASRWGGGMPRFFMGGGVEAHTGDRNVKIVLDPNGGIRGRVQLAGGGVPEWFAVIVDNPPGIRFDQTPEFVITPLEAGKHVVTITGSGFADTSVGEIEVPSDSVLDLGTITLEAGRTVAGRVLDGTGRPVSGAVVVVARQLVGDGSSLTLDLGEMFDQRMGIRRVYSGPDGEYALAGVGYESMVLVAEHEQFGRSLPVKLEPGREDLQKDLVLEGFGTIEGRVTAGGKPRGGVVVTAVAAGNAEQVTLAQAGDEGTFRFDKIPAGEHRISAVLRMRGMGGRAESRIVTVRAGEITRVDIDIPLGEVELTVNVAGEGGAEIKLAQVILVPGIFQGGKVGDFNKRATSIGGGLMSGFWRAGKPVVLKEVIDGQYSVCVVPLDGDLSDPSFLMKLNKYRDQLMVYCKPFKVEPAPAKQQYTAVVPPMQPFVEPDQQSAQ